ncbi:MAG: hypothetical protein OEX04_06730 [Acidimicrobiia bacterium]|nr:hypothetical protein [Acidimicrobiia bacterium]MDH4307158.1 hypothetical protein [Acidimicrobiia bacterium]MDH5292300.1 hypothetical protein [Acidimicrobiia bacterium]
MTSLLTACALGVGVAVLASIVHRLLRLLDRQGWIFYGTEPRRPIGYRTAMALMEFETLFNPPVEHVLEYRRHGDLWIQVGSADDPDGRGDEGRT